MTKEEAYLAIAKMIQDTAERKGGEYGDLAFLDPEEVVEIVKEVLKREEIKALRHKRN